MSNLWLFVLFFTLNCFVLLLAPLCQDEGDDYCLGKWMCASLSQTHHRLNRPCFVWGSGEVGVWACHSTYSSSNWNGVQTFRPEFTGCSPLCVLRHSLSLTLTKGLFPFYTQTYSYSLNQSSHFAKMTPYECLCSRGVCVYLKAWMHT